MTSTQKLRCSYRTPKAVASNVKSGLLLAKTWKRGGDSLLKGDSITWGDIQKMNNYFEGHPNSYNPNKLEADGGPNEDTINWLLCGGTAGKQWFKRMVNQNQEEPMKKFEYKSNVFKVDESLGLVFGFAITCK